MKTIFEHVEHIKGKPHHVRKRVAFSVATFGAAFIAFVWLAVSVSTGAFAIKGSSFAESTDQGSVLTTGSDASINQLAGAGAAAALEQSEDAPAHIEIVNTTPAAPQKQAEQTTLPF